MKIRNIMMKKSMYQTPCVEVWNTTPLQMMALSGGGDAKIDFGGNASENPDRPLDAKGAFWGDDTEIE